MNLFRNITKNYVIITILTIIILASIIHYANFLSIIEGYTNTKKSNTTQTAQTTQTGQSSNQKKQADLAFTIFMWILIIIAIIIVLFILFYLSTRYWYYRNNNYGQGYITPVGTTTNYQGQPGSTVPNLGIKEGASAVGEFLRSVWQGGKRRK